MDAENDWRVVFGPSLRLLTDVEVVVVNNADAAR